MIWEKLIEVVGRDHPALIVVATLAVVFIWFQRKQQLAHEATLNQRSDKQLEAAERRFEAERAAMDRWFDRQQEAMDRRFDEQTRAVSAAHETAIRGLQETVRVLQLERDALRKERNSLRRELNRPVDERE